MIHFLILWTALAADTRPAVMGLTWQPLIPFNPPGVAYVTLGGIPCRIGKDLEAR